MATVVNKRYREFVDKKARLRVKRQFYLDFDSFNIYPNTQVQHTEWERILLGEMKLKTYNK